MGAQAGRQHRITPVEDCEDRGRVGALARAGALDVGECVRLGLGAVGVRHVPLSRPAEQGAPLPSPAPRRRLHQRLAGAILKIVAMTYIPPPLISDISEGRCLPFIGAGFSMNAKLPPNTRMPDWNGLTAVLAE